MYKKLFAKLAIAFLLLLTLQLAPAQSGTEGKYPAKNFYVFTESNDEMHVKMKKYLDVFVREAQEAGKKPLIAFLVEPAECTPKVLEATKIMTLELVKTYGKAEENKQGGISEQQNKGYPLKALVACFQKDYGKFECTPTEDLAKLEQTFDIVMKKVDDEYKSPMDMVKSFVNKIPLEYETRLVLVTPINGDIEGDVEDVATYLKKRNVTLDVVSGESLIRNGNGGWFFSFGRNRQIPEGNFIRDLDCPFPEMMQMETGPHLILPVPSGFGCWGLGRLVYETNGRYFMGHFGGGGGGFVYDRAKMELMPPFYGPRGQYKNQGMNDLDKAVYETYDNLRGYFNQQRYVLGKLPEPKDFDSRNNRVPSRDYMASMSDKELKAMRVDFEKALKSLKSEIEKSEKDPKFPMRSLAVAGMRNLQLQSVLVSLEIQLSCRNVLENLPEIKAYNKKHKDRPGYINNGNMVPISSWLDDNAQGGIEIMSMDGPQTVATPKGYEACPENNEYYMMFRSKDKDWKALSSTLKSDYDAYLEKWKGTPYEHLAPWLKIINLRFTFPMPPIELAGGAGGGDMDDPNSSSTKPVGEPNNNGPKRPPKGKPGRPGSGGSGSTGGSGSGSGK